MENDSWHPSNFERYCAQAALIREKELQLEKEQLETFKLKCEVKRLEYQLDIQQRSGLVLSHKIITKAKELRARKDMLKEKEKQKDFEKQMEEHASQQSEDFSESQDQLQKEIQYWSNRFEKLCQLQESRKGKYRFYCRIKPCKKKQNSTISVVDNQTINFHFENRSDTYYFSRVFSQKQSQELVFEEFKSLIMQFFSGIDVIFLFIGQSGSGKSYTLEGNEKQPGIILQTFELLKALAKNNQTFTLKAKDFNYENTKYNFSASKQGKDEHPEIKTFKEVRGEELFQKYKELSLSTRTKNQKTEKNPNSSRSNYLFKIELQQPKSSITFFDTTGTQDISQDPQSIMIRKMNSDLRSLLRSQIAGTEKVGAVRQHPFVKYIRNVLSLSSKMTKMVFFFNLSSAEVDSTVTRDSLSFLTELKSGSVKIK